MSDTVPTPRVAKSLDDLRVGQVVVHTNQEEPVNNGTFRVAFIDPPEAILKNVKGGWPRILWQIKDFDLPHVQLVILSDPEPDTPTAREGRSPLDGAFEVTNPCPECGNRSVLGFLYLNQDGQHMHTHYVCTFWASPSDVEGSRCGWHGWTVPDAPDPEPPALPTEPTWGIVRYHGTAKFGEWTIDATESKFERVRGGIWMGLDPAIVTAFIPLTDEQVAALSVSEEGKP